VSLLRAGEQARAQQLLDGRRDARLGARTLRDALQRAEVLQLVPEAEHFAVRDGAVAVPPAVGWLEADASADDDPLLLAKERQAQQAEFAAGDAKAAVAVWGDLLGERGPQGRARWPVLAAAAWQGQRSGDAERAARLARELDEALAAADAADLRAPSAGRAVASAALLAAERTQALPAWAQALLPALDPALAAPLFARLRERGVHAGALEARQQAVAARRARLRAAQQLFGAPSPSAHSGRLWLWFPGHDETGVGEGALADAPPFATALAARLGVEAPLLVDGPQFRLGYVPDDAEEVVPSLWYVEPRPPAALPLFARPAAALAAVLTLAFVFAGSALLAVRALRQRAAAVRTRAEFLTMVTHELKTPLAAIRLLGEMLVEGRVPAGREREYYGLLAGEAARLSMLIENVLDLGRMERGERAYDLRATDLAEIVRESVALFAPVAQRDGVALALDEGAPRAVAPADRGALLQALLNVLDNARKYAAAGGRIAVTTAARGASFEVALRDFGPGVADDEREAIFDRFHRGARHAHGAVPGVGLGLYLARQIARRHGGELRCAQPPDGPGAVFTFTLPCAQGGA
jgi:two-component system phosphate regulon sensor histidine kinase PhoR